MKTPVKEIELRLEKLRASMRREKVNAVYIVNEASVRYFSGFTGSDSSLLVCKSGAYLITDSRYTTEAESSAPKCEIITRKKGLAAVAADICRKKRVKTVGIEGKMLSFSEAAELKKGANVKLQDFGANLYSIRNVKSPFEIKAIIKALRIAEASFEELKTRLRKGMLEREVALELEWLMRSRGAEGVAFPTIAAVGANAALPHAHPEKRKLSPGKMLLIDWGARLDGYNSDLTRTLFIDSISPAWSRRYNLVLDSQLLAIKSIAAGVGGSVPDSRAREVLGEGKIAEYFCHSLGHGVGLEVHEGPVLSAKSDKPLEAGNVVTVEPGVYFPRSGGIRIEDMVVVTEKGCKVISKVAKDLGSMVTPIT